MSHGREVAPGAFEVNGGRQLPEVVGTPYARGYATPDYDEQPDDNLRRMLGGRQTPAAPSLPDVWRPSALVASDQYRAGTVCPVPAAPRLR